ncbi:hypothetical protein LTR41_000139 [Exophiala xenobiotica]|nr:hypothetical protein LTR41_000139 [Exophiala xenobiotica]
MPETLTMTAMPPHPTIAPGDHRAFMEYALDQARLSPQAPTKFRVGAVLVDGDTGRIISSGHSSELLPDLPGDPDNLHAEHCCLIKAAEHQDIEETKVGQILPPNTVLYTTMEPCNERLSGYKSCVDRLLELRNQIKLVYMGISEPGAFLPSADGRKRLEDAGIEVRQIEGMQDRILEVATGGQRDIVSLPENEAIDGKDDWRTIVPGRGLELVVRDLREAMPSFQELEKSNFQPSLLPYSLLVPVPADISNDKPFSACKIQFSSIEGGTIITIAHSHSVADGSGTNELMRVLAEETRRAQEHDSLPQSTAETEALDNLPTGMGLDRSFMRTIASDIPFNINDHPGYSWNPEPAAPNHPFVATAPGVPVLIRISPAGLARLRSDASSSREPGVLSIPISTHDALAALMWRTVLLIKSRRSEDAGAVPLSTKTSLFMPSDARRHLVGLPASYVGNAVYQLTAGPLELGTLLGAAGLVEGARALRTAINAVTVAPEKVKSLMAMTNQRWIPWAFLSTAETTGFPMGTDWTGGPEVYGYDWGSAFGGKGGMVRYRYPDEAFNVVFPRLPDGSAEVVVAVLRDEVEVVKGVEGFGRYMEET